MLGVVLWSDPQESKAVIWCEDHGDLAFYNQTARTTCTAFGLDAGDLVEFDVRTARNLRYAENPQVVSEGLFLELPASLGLEKAVIDQTCHTAQIIPFHIRPAANCDICDRAGQAEEATRL